jgi:RND family efflux transporter MFP subunit
MNRRLVMAEGKRRRWLKPAIVLSILVLLVVLIIVRAGAKKEKNVVGQDRLQPVEVTRVVKGPFGEEFSVAGMVTAFTEAKVTPRVAGRVVSVNAGLGQRVAQGEALITIDQADYLNGLRVAEANLASARANSIQAETGYGNARANYERVEQLYNQGAAAKSELEQARGQYATAESGYKANQALISQCEAAFDKARMDYENTVVRAPFAGVVAQRLTDLGEMVSQQTPAVILIQDNPLLIKVSLGESMVSHVAPGQKVEVFIASSGKSYQGTVRSVAPQADAANRAFPVEITLDNPGDEVKPGMVADLRLTTKKVDDALVVPSDALMEEDNGAGIFVLEGDTVKHRKVTTGMSGQGSTQVVSGLNEGEVVVVKGNHLLIDGMKVQVKETDLSQTAPTGGEAN